MEFAIPALFSAPQIQASGFAIFKKPHWSSCSELALCPAVSKGGRNTLIFLERWSVYNEVSHTDVLYGQAEV
jgi:hypothetical protein